MVRGLFLCVCRAQERSGNSNSGWYRGITRGGWVVVCSASPVFVAAPLPVVRGRRCTVVVILEMASLARVGAALRPVSRSVRAPSNALTRRSFSSAPQSRPEQPTPQNAIYATYAAGGIAGLGFLFYLRVRSHVAHTDIYGGDGHH